ncbi:hypothetical protein C1H46_040769 [Malus baccata]|uniref:Uncharacterized protein n=1 Tax=Malus baccata TaxID=106549 RepID=A0A540KHJ6_MALBA|nr:hypothetical protein C1H46_040769 [Malus baccata]
MMSRLTSIQRTANSGSPTCPPPTLTVRSPPATVDPPMAALGGPGAAQALASSTSSVAVFSGASA